MAIVNALDRYKHFSEFQSPLQTGVGVKTPSVRKAEAQYNLGLNAGSTTVPGASVYRKFQAPATAVGTATLTTAQVLNGLIHGTPVAAAAYTLPLASAMDTALPDFETGDAVEFYIVNLAATVTFDITVTTNTGWTLAGPMVVGAGSSAAGDGSEWTAGRFIAMKTGTATWTLYRAG